MGRRAGDSRSGRLPSRMMVADNGSGLTGPKHHQGAAMEYYAGIDVPLEQNCVCVVAA